MVLFCFVWFPYESGVSGLFFDVVPVIVPIIVELAAARAVAAFEVVLLKLVAATGANHLIHIIFVISS